MKVVHADALAGLRGQTPEVASSAHGSGAE